MESSSRVKLINTGESSKNSWPAAARGHGLLRQLSEHLGGPPSGAHAAVAAGDEPDFRELFTKFDRTPIAAFRSLCTAPSTLHHAHRPCHPRL